MPRTQAVRKEVQRLIQAKPFHPFVLTLENGDRVVVEHPEIIAFDPYAQEGQVGAEEFYLFYKAMRIFGTFDAVTSVALADRGELAS